jgi:hypothetical protein
MYTPDTRTRGTKKKSASNFIFYWYWDERSFSRSDGTSRNPTGPELARSVDEVRKKNEDKNHRNHS